MKGMLICCRGSYARKLFTCSDEAILQVAVQRGR
jgi:hypothetical protein